MGHSQTINVIGRSKPKKLKDGYIIYHETHAMTKLEMAQNKKLMESSRHYIVEWFAQTAQGCKMLGTNKPYELISDSEVRHIKTITCPICNGSGGAYHENSNIKHSCAVCNGSGITKNNHWNKWRDWQIQAMKKEFGTI